MTQTTVDSPAAIGVAGQLADLFTVKNGDVTAGTNEEAVNPIPFGVMVKKGTAVGRIKLPTAAADVLLGILVHAQDYDDPTQLSNVTVNTNLQAAIKTGITGGLLRKGKILVIPEATGTEASQVHMRIVASGGNTQLGSFTPTAEAGKTVNCSSFARWCDGVPTLGQPSTLDIDLTNSALVVAD